MTPKTKTTRAKRAARESAQPKAGPRVIRKYPNRRLYDTVESRYVGAIGGRDALVKAYQAMLSLGHGRQGDALVVSRVPWISYNWGPYGVGANVLYAPGYPETGWAYSDEGLRACVEFSERSGRKVAGLLITSPDNPTGNTLLPAQ